MLSSVLHSPRAVAVNVEIIEVTNCDFKPRGVKTEDLEPLLVKVMEQAEALCADWPIAA